MGTLVLHVDAKLRGLIAVTLSVLLLRSVTSATTIDLRTNSPGQVRLICEDENHNTVADAVWRRGDKEGLTVDDFASSVELASGEIRFHGSLDQSSLSPSDEGDYSCRAPSETPFGEKRPFEVNPYVQEGHRNITHERGTNLTIPCGVTIGEVSRQKGFTVQWDQLRKGNSFVDTAIIYTSASGKDLVSQDKLHVLNLTDFSLQVFNFSRDNLVYRCTVRTVTFGRCGFAETAIFHKCDHPQISKPLPEIVVTRPEEGLTVNFTFTSSPNPMVRWKLDSRAVEVRPILIMESKRTYTVELNLAGLEGGVLVATVENCGVSVSTEMKLVVVANLKEVRLIQKDQCDTPALSFFLPQNLPDISAELNVELLVRFTEVREGGTAMGRTEETKEYGAAEIVGKTNVTRFKLTELPNSLDGREYRIEVILSVNGTMSSNWSSAEGILIPTEHCPPKETTELQLLLIFEEECDVQKENELAEAIEDSFEGWCEGPERGCEGNLEFRKDTATLQCDSTQRGSFSVTIESRAASTLAEGYYSYLEGSGGDQVEVRGQAVTVHSGMEPTEPPEEEDEKKELYMFYAVVGGVAVFVLIVFLLVVIVIKHKRKAPVPAPVTVNHTPSPPPEEVHQPFPEGQAPPQPAFSHPPHLPSSTPPPPTLPSSPPTPTLAPSTPPPASVPQSFFSLSTLPDFLHELNLQSSPTPSPHPPVDNRGTPPPSPPPHIVVIYLTPPPSPPPSQDPTPPPSLHSTPPASPPPARFPSDSNIQYVASGMDQFRSPCSQCGRHYTSNPELQRHPVSSLLGQLLQPQAQQQASPQPSRNLWSQNCSYDTSQQNYGRQRHHSDMYVNPRSHTLPHSTLALNHRPGVYSQTIPSHAPSAFVPVPQGDVPTCLGSDRPSSGLPDGRRNVSTYVLNHPLARSSVASCSSVASAPVYVPSESYRRPSPPFGLPTRPPFQRMRSRSCSDAEPCAANAGCARRLPQMSPPALGTSAEDTGIQGCPGLLDWPLVDGTMSYVEGGVDQAVEDDELEEEMMDA